MCSLTLRSNRQLRAINNVYKMPDRDREAGTQLGVDSMNPLLESPSGRFNGGDYGVWEYGG